MKKTEIKVYRDSPVTSSLKIKTAPYPGFPTDLQAQLILH